jgi:ankyrin repeat protein
MNCRAHRIILFFLALLALMSRAGRAQTINEAAMKGDLAAVKRLLRADTHLANFVGGDGNTPLHFAAHWGRYEVAQLLIASGANVNATGRRDDNWTPLFCAVQQGQTDLARLLIASHAEVDWKDKIGNTPLHFAAGDNRPEIADLLIAGGANVNDRRTALDDWTPIFSAAGNGRVEAMRVLLRRGADFGLRSRDGNMPIHKAAQNGMSETIAVLIAAGADIDTPNADGNTPLAVAAWYGRVNVAQFLLGAGADLHHRNRDGKTAMDEARRSGKQDFVNYLQRYQAALEERAVRDLARKSSGLHLRTRYAAWEAPNAHTKKVYRSNFATDRIGPEWATASLPGAEQAPLRLSTTPRGGRRFLGELSSQAAQLTLTGLPPHKEVSVAVTLLVIRAWQGSDAYVGPGIWSLGVVDGPTLVQTTFANFCPVDSPNIKIQAYPGEYPGDFFAPRTDAEETNTLGYTYTFRGETRPLDAVYTLNYTFAHTGSALILDFAARSLLNVKEQSWGIANVEVSVDGASSAPTQAFVVRPRPVAPRVIYHTVRPTAAKPHSRATTRKPSQKHGKNTTHGGKPAQRLHDIKLPPKP